MNLVKKLIAGAVLGLVAAAATAAPVTYTFDTTHSRVTFYVNHFGFSNSVGEFKVGDGTFTFDSDDWSKSKVSAHIPVQSLELGDLKWNTHVLSADFLEAAKYPEITFHSKSAAIEDDILLVKGDLTIHGVTREVEFTVEGPTPPVKDPWGNTRVGVSASTKIDRREFGLTFNAPMETGGVMVGEEVSITLELEFVQAA